MGERHPTGPPCVTCILMGAGYRREDDPLHGQAELGGIANPNAKPRFPQHAYDPGERRHGTRRAKDRQDEAWEKERARHDADEWNREHPNKK